ncbi:MAG TPA: TIGR02206 family membrane protein [Vicinamibacteria bacterium]|nr:TIGR02206 family membrane protein [Vicinamibacteria bacterium]
MPSLEEPPAFVAFGATHVGALACVALVAVLLVRLVRARPGLATLVRGALAAGIVGLLAFELNVASQEGWLSWKTLLPLELCDAALVLAVLALLRPRQTPAEIVYFWAGSGTVLAMLTPELPWGFPRWEFVVFFGLHGLVLAAALVLVFGLGLRPRPMAAWRTLGITAGWTAFVGVVNLLLGTNFMYLRHKPTVATPLDWMGPWPVYIGVCGVVALFLFHALALPFRRRNLYS